MATAVAEANIHAQDNPLSGCSGVQSQLDENAA
jgi:hypothetical protein